jgi:uncharacterized SAM-binding protein YcdF (DUF218 family)
VYPYTWLCRVTGALAVLVFLPSSPARFRWLRALTVAALIIVWILGAPIVSAIGTGLLESRYPHFDGAAGARFDAVVVLGAGVAGRGSLRPSNQLSGPSMQRTVCGADLFAGGRAPRLVLSGGDATIFGEGPKEAEEMRRLAIHLGVPEEAILLDDRSRTTYENAAGVKRVLGGGSVLLVTSATHMPRAVGLFRKQGLEVTPAPCIYRLQEWPGIWANFDLFDFVPNLNALDGSTNTLTEIVGIITYWATGKM